MPGKRYREEELQFFAIKCKLQPLLNSVNGRKHLIAIREAVPLANNIARGAPCSSIPIVYGCATSECDHYNSMHAASAIEGGRW